MEDYKLFDNKAKKRFEFRIGELVPQIDYMLPRNGVIYLIHTEVPFELAGKGIGSRLVEKTLDHCEREGFKVVPTCPFIAKYIRANPDWERVVISI